MTSFFVQWWKKAVFFMGGGGWKTVISLVAGVGLIAFLTMALRPFQKDSGHVVGFFDTQGGRVLHPAEFMLGESFYGVYTLTITGRIGESIQGDVQVDVSGASPVNYRVTSRNPPAVPLYNQGRSWYRFKKDTFYNVSPGDNLIVFVKVHTPVEAGEYQVTFKNRATGQSYLTVPVAFTNPAQIAPVAPAGEDCH
jgi:hypothetical protein